MSTQCPAKDARHDGSERFVEPVQPVTGQALTLRVVTGAELAVTAVHVRVLVDGEPRFVPAVRSSADEHGQWWTARLDAENPVVAYRFLLSTAAGARVLNGLGLFDREVSDAHDFRLCTTRHVPDWVPDAVAYQVFCDRFAPGGVEMPDPLPDWAVPAAWGEPLASNTPDGVRQLYGGTLWGVMDHLDHLADLGVTLLYLTPFFPARSNHRYDATTFDHVDPLLGGDEALRALCAAAAARGIRVIGDLTLNHTGVGHDWFRTAQADPASAEAGFYLFEDDQDGPGYACFWGIDSLPKLDHRSPELRRRLYEGPDSVVAHYVRDLGLSGWRIDVAQSAGIHRDVDLAAEVARATRRTLDEVAPGSYLVAEVNHDATGALQGDGWQGTMAYAWFTRPVWSWLAGADVERQWGVPASFGRLDGHGFVAQCDEFTSQVPFVQRQASLTLLGSHDTARIRTIASRRAHEAATALMLTLPGVPMFFAGDEYGVEGNGLEDSRRPFPWEGERDDDFFETCRRLVALRHGHEALRRGGMQWLGVEADAVLFERATSDETLVVLVQRDRGTHFAAPARMRSLLDGSVVGAGEPLCAPLGYGIWQVLGH